MEQQQTLYDAAPAYISPEDNEADIRIVAEEIKELFVESVNRFLDEGFLVWQKDKPADQLAELRRMAGPGDQLLLLQPQLTRLMATGLLPLPLSPFWQKLGELPPLAREIAINRFAGEFRRLMRALGRE